MRRGEERCMTCGADCSKHHLMCDEMLEDDEIWCPRCFKKTPCGMGEHDEECCTIVIGG